MRRRVFGLAVVKYGLMALVAGAGLIGGGVADSAVAAPIYPNKAAFQAACEKAGGTYTNLGWFVGCTLPNGHIIACDSEFSTCQRVDDMEMQPGGSGTGTVTRPELAIDQTTGVFVESTPTPDPKWTSAVDLNTDASFVEETPSPNRGGRIDRSTIVTPEAAAD